MTGSQSISATKNFIVALLYDRGSFAPRQDLMIDSKSSEAEYSRNHLKVHHSISDLALNQLIEESILIEMQSSDLLEEIIRTGMPEDESFTDRDIVRTADDFLGDSIICFGPRFNFHILENYSDIVEMCEFNRFDEFKDFCTELVSAFDNESTSPKALIERENYADELSEIDASLEELEKNLRQSNDLNKVLAESKEALIGEIRLLRQLISLDSIRPTALISMAKRTLGYLAHNSTAGIIGGAATAIMAKILGLM